MNIVDVKTIQEPRILNQGSLWIDLDTREIYILGMVGMAEWVAICLGDGNRFREPRGSRAGAIEGLKYLGEGLKITVEVSNGNPQS